MADINGTIDGETINGTADPDTINAGGGDDIVNGLGGNDTLNGDDGDDTLDGGLGVDQLFGGANNDLLLATQGSLAGETYDGGSGYDTIESRVGSLAFGNATVTSIESIRFGSAGNSLISIGLTPLLNAGVQQVVGNAGINTFVITTVAGGGNLTVPNLNMIGWNSAPFYGIPGDLVVMTAATGDFTLNSREGLASTQLLIGNSGNDTLNGASGRDMLNGAGGVNVLNGGGGDDLLMIVNNIPQGGSFPTNFTGLGSTFDGGDGIDFLTIGGVVYVEATLVNIEGIALQATTGTPGTGGYQPPAVAELNLERFAMLPTNFQVAGVGTIDVDLEQGDSFDFSQVIYADGPTDVRFFFDGESDGLAPTAVTWVGTSRGDDFVFGTDVVTVTGGGGADRFYVGGSDDGDTNVTVLDFVRGEDKIDFTDTGVTNSQRAGDFASEEGNDQLITAYGDGHSIQYRFVNRADLDETDVIFATSPGVQIIEAGTEFNDILFGFELNDELHGAGGNDRLYSGVGGVDNLYGDAGDDTLIVESVFFGPSGPYGSIYDGGSGSDTIEARSPLVNLGVATLSGIESIRFGDPGSSTVILGFAQVTGTGLTHVIGNEGLNTLFIGASPGGGTFTMPELTFANWTTSHGVPGDFVVFSANPTGDYVLNGREGLGVLQVLAGGGGNDTLNGTSAIDVLNGAGGINVLNGNGGDDVLAITNGVPFTGGLATNFTGAGSTFNGGDGVDRLGIGATVTFEGTLVSVEGIDLLPSSGAPGQPGYQSAAVLEMDLAHFAMLPTNFTVAGNGLIDPDINEGESFDFSEVVFAPDADVLFYFDGESGLTNPVAATWVGTSRGDHFELGSDFVTLDGGGGIDVLELDGARGDYTLNVVGGVTHVQGPDTNSSFFNVELLRIGGQDYHRQLTGGFDAPVLLTASFGAGASAGGWSSQRTYPRTLADVNGDGLADLIGFGDSGVFAALADGNGAFGAAFLAFGGYGAGASAGGWSDNQVYPRTLGDVNGDGMDDLAGFGDGGVYVSLATGGGSFGQGFLAFGGYGAGASAGGWSDTRTYPRLLADVNGDGMDDLVGFGDGGVHVSLALGGGSFAQAILGTAGFGAGAASGGWSDNDVYTRTLADMNGDGRADIVGFGSGGVQIAFARSDGTFADPFFAYAGFGAEPSAGGWTSNNLYYRTVGDLDGDGHADLVGFGDGGVFAAYGDGTGQFAAAELVVAGFGAGASAGGWASQDLYPRLLADLNGDGADDIVGFGDGGVQAAANASDWVLV